MIRDFMKPRVITRVASLLITPDRWEFYWALSLRVFIWGDFDRLKLLSTWFCQTILKYQKNRWLVVRWYVNQDDYDDDDGDDDDV